MFSSGPKRLDRRGSETVIDPESHRNPSLADITTDDGTKFQLRVARARDAEKGPIALVLPALGVRARYYERFARRLSEQDLTCVTVDLRGQGDSTAVAQHGYREIVEKDFPQILDEVATRFPKRDIWIVGHSLGGQLALIACGLHPARAAGIVLVATGSAWYGGFTGARRIRNLVLSQMVGATSRLLGFWPGDNLGFGGRQPQALMLDWAAQVRTGRYRARGSMTDYEAAMGALDFDVHFVEVDGDALAPPGCVDHLCEKLLNARVSRWVYSGKPAPLTNLDHFSWARQSPGLAEYVAGWIFEHYDKRDSAN